MEQKSSEASKTSATQTTKPRTENRPSLMQKTRAATAVAGVLAGSFHGGVANAAESQRDSFNQPPPVTRTVDQDLGVSGPQLIDVRTGAPFGQEAKMGGEVAKSSNLAPNSSFEDQVSRNGVIEPSGWIRVGGFVGSDLEPGSQNNEYTFYVQGKGIDGGNAIAIRTYDFGQGDKIVSWETENPIKVDKNGVYNLSINARVDTESLAPGVDASKVSPRLEVVSLDSDGVAIGSSNFDPDPLTIPGLWGTYRVNFDPAHKKPVLINDRAESIKLKFSAITKGGGVPVDAKILIDGVNFSQENHQMTALPAAFVEKHPELEGQTAKLLEIEGPSIKDDISKGPKVYKITAQNGVRLQARIRQDYDPTLVQNSFVRSKLYDANGNQVSGDADTFIEMGIFYTGDYYLVVDREPKTVRPNYGITVEALNRYDHGIQMTFLRDPLKPWATELRFAPEVIPIIRDKNMGVIMTVHPDSDLFNTKDWSAIVKVYAQPGEADDLYKHRGFNPYDEQSLLRNYKVYPEKIVDGDGKTKLIRLVIIGNQPNGEPGFPDGHIVTVRLKDWGAYHFATTPP